MQEVLREIVLDTETTGFNYSGDDRIVEIGCVEMVNHTPSGRTYHAYVNPEREVPENVVRVHGLTTEFLAGKPKFKDVADAFLEFVGEAAIVAHNAVFDMNFVNAELVRAGLAALPFDRMVDTLSISRKKNPHVARHDLDSLCQRYGIDNSHRELHGALLDARLLAEVYIELLGGKEVDFFRKSDDEVSIDMAEKGGAAAKKPLRAPRPFPPSEAETAAHAEFVKGLGENPVWTEQPEPIP
ncbi:MAG: DNA polymerase III subunit epsilon [Rickettsiales bacterium]|nr:DNA polymerase III subunit epsilon [Rickettsiales bacterium]